MVNVGDVISYWEMCSRERSALQKGMNYRLHGKTSVLLMSRRRGAPYVDRIEEDGRVLIYEGHDMPRKGGVTDPKALDQPMMLDGRLTQNGLFYEAALRAKRGEQEPELVRVYEKVRGGIWTYNGRFRLLDSWRERNGNRMVFKYRLEIEESTGTERISDSEQEHTRVIPSSVKIEVWKRDKGKCAECGSSENLHFDHIIPYSKGGSSLIADNIQLLCSRCNLTKRDHIM
jgi:hypothetical protein